MLHNKRITNDEDPEEEHNKPDFLGHEADIDGWSANYVGHANSPRWIVRVVADQPVLDALAAESGAQRLDNVPVDRLNSRNGVDKSKAGWEYNFRILQFEDQLDDSSSDGS